MYRSQLVGAIERSREIFECDKLHVPPLNNVQGLVVKALPRSLNIFFSEN